MSEATLRAADSPPNVAAKLVLRVLTGPNAGAELPLGDGDWLIGSGPAADITFAEAALAQAHLRLSVRGSEITGAALAEGVRTGAAAIPVDAPQVLAPLEPLWIGATAFAVGPTGAAWPEPSPPEPSPPAPSPPASPTAEAATLTVTPERTPISAQPSGRVSRHWHWLVLAVICLLVLLIGVIFAMTGGAGKPPVAEGPPPPDKLAQAQAVIRELGLGDAVAATDNGSFITLNGLVASEAQQRALQERLQRVGVNSDFNVITEAHLRDLAGTVLRGFDIDPKITATGVGEVRLSGYANDEQTVTAAIRQLRADVPWIQRLDDAVVTSERARGWLEGGLREAGVSGLKMSTAPHVVTVTGLLAADNTEAWNQLAKRFQEKFDGNVRLSNQILPRAAVAPQGVSLGQNPYIIMTGQKRLVIGDQFGSFGRIVGIYADKLRVRAATGDIDIRYAHSPNWIVEDRNAEP